MKYNHDLCQKLRLSVSICLANKKSSLKQAQKGEKTIRVQVTLFPFP